MERGHERLKPEENLNHPPDPERSSPGESRSLSGTGAGRILFVNACVRPESRTRALAGEVLSRLTGQIEEVNLEQERIPALDDALLRFRESCIRQGNYDAPVFRFAHQLTRADTVVIAAPYWDLSFPALLKVYLESVMIQGLTFTYTPEGIPQSLCHVRRLIYVTTAGGPIGENHFGFEYVKALFRAFFQVEDARCLAAEGLDIAGADADEILARARQRAAEIAAP